MNRQIISVIITFVFIGPLVFFMQQSIVKSTTPLIEMQGTIHHAEYAKQVNARLKKKIRIYYNDRKYIEIYNNTTYKLHEIFKSGEKFKAIMIKNSGYTLYGNTVLDLKIGNNHILQFDTEIKNFNHNMYLQIVIFSSIVFIVLVGNILVYYNKWNPMNIVRHKYFTWLLYLVAILGVVRFFLDRL